MLCISMNLSYITAPVYSRPSCQWQQLNFYTLTLLNIILIKDETTTVWNQLIGFGSLSITLNAAKNVHLLSIVIMLLRFIKEDFPFNLITLR